MAKIGLVFITCCLLPAICFAYYTGSEGGQDFGGDTFKKSGFLSDTDWKSKFANPGKDDIVIDNTIGGSIPSITNTKGSIIIGSTSGGGGGGGWSKPERSGHENPDQVMGGKIGEKEPMIPEVGGEGDKGTEETVIARPPTVPHRHHHHKEHGQGHVEGQGEGHAKGHHHHSKTTHSTSLHFSLNAKLCPHNKHGKCAGTNVQISLALFALSTVWLLLFQ